MTNPIELPRVECRDICGKPLTFIIECLRQHYIHLCAIDEIANVLRVVPPGDMEGLELFVLHQPKIGEQARCAWGGYIAQYLYEDKLKCAVVLDAVEDRAQLTSVRMADRAAEQEVEYLREEGHQATLIDGRYFITSSSAAIRRTQLYRTAYHLIYHHMEAFRDIRAELDRERNANHYALEMKQKWFSDLLKFD